MPDQSLPELKRSLIRHETRDGLVFVQGPDPERTVPLYMGIDGGGSTLRIVIVTGELETVALLERAETVNPVIIGREQSAAMMQSGIRVLLERSEIIPSYIVAAGIGVAGADTLHSHDWLMTILPPVLPDTQMVPSADYEIALVGGIGKREGVLLLAGTGSVAYGINVAGDKARVGGWGYLIGDEGGGYWMGAEGLKAVTHAVDGRGEATALTDAVFNYLDITNPFEIPDWLYGRNEGRNSAVAKLAPLVMAIAADGDPVADGIVERGADALYGHYLAIIKRLNMGDAEVVFAGGLLESPTLLQQKLLLRLGLSEPPKRSYPPVMGAALLAKIVLQLNGKESK